jgi:hypothetical protein
MGCEDPAGGGLDAGPVGPDAVGIGGTVTSSAADVIRQASAPKIPAANAKQRINPKTVCSSLTVARMTAPQPRAKGSSARHAGLSGIGRAPGGI